MLTSDDERERKAEASYPGTYYVIVNPESFSSLPEYADDASSVDLNIGHLKIRRGSSSTLSQKDDIHSISEINDPNAIILDTFEDNTHRSSLANWRRTRLSPASDITSASILASPTSFPAEQHGSMTSDPAPAGYSGQEELLLAHFRDVVWKQLIQGQSCHDLFSPLSSPITPGVEIFEELASTFQPVSRAIYPSLTSHANM